MRIRETKEEEKIIRLDRACIYMISDGHAPATIQNPAHTMAQSDGYVGKSLNVNSTMGFTAKFKVTEERDMTPEEEQAYHFIKAVKGKRCSDCIFQGKCQEASHGICCRLFLDAALKHLEGKEVVR